jgi:hypothetical protein
MIFDARILAGSGTGWAWAVLASAAAANKLILTITRFPFHFMPHENGGPEDPPPFIRCSPKGQKIILTPAVKMRPVLA